MEPGKQYQLDATDSYDPESDALTFEWSAPAGITLDDPFSTTPSFTAPDADHNTAYSFRLTVSDGEFTSSDTVVALLLNPIGIDEASATGMSVYPNPTKGLFTVTVEHPGVEYIRMIDMRGKVMMDRKWNGEQEITLDLHDAPYGIYMVIVETEERVVTGTIVKE